jgi:threonine dehydrogenase-like Zn-dependent dehydrogenase
MGATCRGVVFTGDGTWDVREFPMPTPPPGGAVLQVEAVGLCASDIAQLHGHKHVPGEVCPVVPGHEIVGRVHALAPDADLGVSVGQRVGVDLVVRGEGPMPALVYGYTKALDDRSGLYGGYGEFMEVVAGTHLVPLPDDVPAEELSLFEPLASCVNWAETAGIRDGDTVVIQGPGHMGLIMTAVAKAYGAGTVIVSGRGVDDLRLAAAREIGADHTVDVDAEDLAARVKELTRGRGADVVVDLADGATVTVSLALEIVAHRGRVLLAGLKNMAPAQLVTDLIVLKGLTVHGGSGSTPASMDKAGELLQAKVLPTRALLGEVRTLDTLDDAMALLMRTGGRDAIRVSLKHGA